MATKATTAASGGRTKGQSQPRPVKAEAGQEAPGGIGGGQCGDADQPGSGADGRPGKVRRVKRRTKARAM